MKKSKKNNVLNHIDDAINDRIEESDDAINDTIDEIKEKNNQKKANNKKNKTTPKSKKEAPKKKEIYDYENEDTEEELLKEVDLNEIEEKLEEKPKEKKSIFGLFKKKKVKVIDDEEDTPKKEKKKLFSKKKEKPVIINDSNDFEEFDEDLIKEVDNNEEHGKKFALRNKPKKVKVIKEKKHKDKKEKPQKQKRPFWKKLITIILIFGIIGVLSVTAFLAYVVVTAPEFNESDLAIKDQTVIYDIDGNVIAKLGTQKRESITYDKLPQVLIDAIIATEDSRFFQHNGVDLFRFIKATLQQLMGQDDAGGASTLTMQTVKNRITQKGNTNEGKIEKVVRKFQDVYLAVFKVEKEYSKEEILEMYVNDNGLGSSYYGVEEASKYYFGKSASELTLPEAAIIAGLFQAPGRHNPYLNIESATARRTTVLKLMKNHGYITEEERKLAEKIPVESLLVGANKSDNKYQGYIDTVVEEVQRLTATADNKYGDDPATIPMKIYTTMNKSIQDGVNGVFTSTSQWIWKDEKVQGAVTIVNSETGAIEAVGAGRNKTGERQFNYATMAKRQPGSTAKPLFDYGPGIEYNNFSSYQLFMDEPWTYTNGPAVNNWDGGYYGLITARYALQVSRNVPALKAFQQVGVRNSQKFVAALGLNVSLNSSSENYEVFSNGLDNTINEAYAIGGAAEGFSTLDMAGAYACFSNGGYYIEPHTITKIVYRETGEEKEFKYTKERVMKDSTAYIMNNILESAVTSGFNGGATVYGSHVAAKTGTSNYDDATMRAKGMPADAVNDLWTVAYTSKYVISVWYGYDEADPKYYNDWGGFKDKLTSEVMKYIPKDTQGWSMPSSVVSVTVEKDTWPAQLPSEYTPNDMKITELFVRGTQPTEVSERYQKLNDIKNYKITETNANSATITWEYETPKVLTKSYLESYFNKSTFGNSKAKMVTDRMNYNKNKLGEVGFMIYKQESDGKLTKLDFVKDPTYTYKGYGTTTLVIKAQHSNFASNASSGVKVTITLDDLNVNNIVATFTSNGAIQTKVGTYEERGFKSITYGTVDISNNVTITYAISGDTNVYTTKEEFETFVNTLEAGSYTITYTITYQGQKVTKTRNLILT